VVALALALELALLPAFAAVLAGAPAVELEPLEQAATETAASVAAMGSAAVVRTFLRTISPSWEAGFYEMEGRG
jgi:hypothetical protein